MSDIILPPQLADARASTATEAEGMGIFRTDDARTVIVLRRGENVLAYPLNAGQATSFILSLAQSFGLDIKQ